jgi:integrase
MAQEAMRTAQGGDDPGRAIAHQRPVRDTVEKLAAEFIEKHAKVKNRDWRKTEGIFRLDVLPAWGKREMRSISRRDCIELLDAAVARTSPVTANRTRAAVHKFLTWAVGRDIIDGNPMSNVPRPGEESSRDRYLSDDEIRLFWRACDDLGPAYGAWWRLHLLTGQRRDEVRFARWEDIDMTTKVWTVHADIAKNEIANEVPLSTLALEILDAIRPRSASGFIFPATTGSDGPAADHHVKAKLDRAMAAQLAEGEAIPHWQRHDLRRTASTGMARLGIAPHIIEKVLNHSKGEVSGVAAVYNRHGYLPEKRQALETWATHLRGVIDPAAGENVVALPGRAAR